MANGDGNEFINIVIYVYVFIWNVSKAWKVERIIMWKKQQQKIKKTLELNNDGEKFNGVIDWSEQARLFEG